MAPWTEQKASRNTRTLEGGAMVKGSGRLYGRERRQRKSVEGGREENEEQASSHNVAVD
jgi:hypothetical protein